MNGFEQLLMDFKGMSQSKAQQGALFERLMKKYFLTCPLYTEMFESVWTWVEFPYNGGKHDSGIDLVAKKILKPFAGLLTVLGIMVLLVLSAMVHTLTA